MAEPKIKFRQDDGSNYPEWETIPMSEIFTEISEKNHPELPVLSVQQGVGTVLRDLSDRNILYDKKNLNGYKAMKKDDFIIHLRSFEGGLECSNYDGISSPAYRILRPNRILSGAYRDYFRSDDFIRNKLAVSVVGIRDGKNIDMDTFWQILITVPCLEEQKKIADFLSDVDTLITTSEQELLKLKELKKGCLQKMFPRGDADVPEVRFPGFTGAWERRKFGDITELKSASRVHRCQWTTTGVPFYRSSDVMSAINGTKNEKAFISEELYEKLSSVSGKLEEGDILVTGGGSVGNPYIVPNNEPLYTKDADLIWIKNQGRFDAYFIYEYFLSPTFRKYLGSVSHVGTIAHYTITQLSETPISLPSKAEQIKIGDYFRHLDNLIALHQKECEKYKELKKGLLQQMFV